MFSEVQKSVNTVLSDWRAKHYNSPPSSPPLSISLETPRFLCHHWSQFTPFACFTLSGDVQSHQFPQRSHWPHHCECGWRPDQVDNRGLTSFVTWISLLLQLAEKFNQCYEQKSHFPTKPLLFAIISCFFGLECPPMPLAEIHSYLPPKDWLSNHMSWASNGPLTRKTEDWHGEVSSKTYAALFPSPLALLMIHPPEAKFGSLSKSKGKPSKFHPLFYHPICLEWPTIAPTSIVLKNSMDFFHLYFPQK